MEVSCLDGFIDTLISSDGYSVVAICADVTALLRYVQVLLLRRSFSCRSRKLDDVRAQQEEVAILTAARGCLALRATVAGLFYQF
jgi:hypothetical protein